MLHKPRKSLPIDIHYTTTQPHTCDIKRPSIDLNSNKLLGNRKMRVDKLDSIIKSTKKYNSSLKDLRESWMKTKSRNSSQSSIPINQIQATSQFSLKVHKLSHYMKTTLIIFSELFAQTRNKKQILRNLHGWEDEFENFFFDDNNINLKRINKSQLISKFGLQKKTSKSASYFNKLKLLVEEINRTNEQRYNLLSEIQLSKIKEKLQMIEEINEEFKRTYHGKDKLKYQGMATKTIDKITGYKMNMWSPCQAMKYIEAKTGPIEVNWFLRNQEKRLKHVENIFLHTEKY